MSDRLDPKTRKVWDILRLAASKFSDIDGAQWAAAFAHYAFFALFPLVILFVTIASVFIARDRAAAEVIAYVENYLPIGGDRQSYIFDTIAGVMNARGKASAVASVMLGWAAMRFFVTLIRATNRAWGAETQPWWRLPLKSMAFLLLMASMVLLGIAVPMLAKLARNWLFLSPGIYALASFFVPLLVLFLSLSLFYMLAPRRPTRFAEVWPAALCATLLLQIAESLFVLYLRNFATLNAVYGAFGGIMALLLWIYLSGCIFIFGACLCAARAERATPVQEAPPARSEESGNGA